MQKRLGRKSRRREPVVHSLLDTEELFQTIGEEAPARRIHRSVVRRNTSQSFDATAQRLQQEKRSLERSLKEASQQACVLQEKNLKLAASLQQVHELSEELHVELEEVHAVLDQLRLQSEEDRSALQTELWQVQQDAKAQAQTHAISFAQFQDRVIAVLQPLLQFTRWVIATASLPAIPDEMQEKVRVLHQPLALAEQLVKTKTPAGICLTDEDLLACLQCQASLIEGVVTQC